MRTYAGVSIALILATGLFAQNRGSVTPTVTGSFGSVVFPGGTPATTPGLARSFGSVVNPGGGGPRLTVPGGVVPGFGRPSNGRRSTPVTTYAYPVYIGGGYGGYYDNSYAPEQAPTQQPNVTVVMPPQQVTPVIINLGAGGGQYTATQRQSGAYEAPAPPTAEEGASGEETAHYLIAFKDHTIYAAVAYWVDGDILHYFTAGNQHNQVSISLLDRELTQRLNKESGIDFKMPAEK